MTRDWNLSPFLKFFSIFLQISVLFLTLQRNSPLSLPKGILRG